MNRTLIDVPWEVRGSTIVCECPIGERCHQAREDLGPGSSNHQGYGGHLIAESVEPEVARYIVEIHNARVSRSRR